MQDLKFIPNHQIERAGRRTQALIDCSQSIATIAALQVTPGLAEIELATIPDTWTRATGPGTTR